MKIYDVTDEEFRSYGNILTGYNSAQFMQVLEQCAAMPENVVYTASESKLERLADAEQLRDNVFGGMPIQIGWCNGHNTALNCLEYHRNSEINLGTEDFILLLAKKEEMQAGVLDTKCIMAFRCPAGTMVEIYATAMHYAPCEAKAGQGFRVMVVLPRGTNTDKPAIQICSEEDRMLWARNKWLLAHPESIEAAQGAYIGIKGENINMEKFI